MMRAPRFGPLTVAVAAASLVLGACGSDGDGEPVVSVPDAESDGADVDTSASDTAAPDTSDTDTDGDAAGSAAPGCPPVGGIDDVVREFDEAPPMCLDPEVSYSALVTTTAGDITIDLDQEAAPVTVNSFVFLARNNYFDDTVCHRVIQGFVAQCGDPTASGRGGPGYQFEDELPAAGEYEIGSIAMANSGPDTNGSQFFIISGPNGAALPPAYSLFGEVSGEGDLDVVAEMDARGSVADGAPMEGEEVRILEVEIIEA